MNRIKNFKSIKNEPKRTENPKAWIIWAENQCKNLNEYVVYLKDRYRNYKQNSDRLAYWGYTKKNHNDWRMLVKIRKFETEVTELTARIKMTKNKVNAPEYQQRLLLTI